jgi:hypothetical protein
VDLSDISRERTLVDLAVTRVRILDLAMKIESDAVELAALRAELAKVRPPVEGGLTRSLATSGQRRWRLWRRSGGRGSVKWHVDEICGQCPPRSSRGIDHVVRRSNSWVLTISGWAVPNGQSSTFTSARLLLTGSTGVLSKQVSVHLRDDVAAHFGNPRLAMSGFRFEIPMSELTVGSYALDLEAFGEAVGETTIHLGRIELT